MSTVRERIGPYEVLGPLGAGGMGEVYVARDPVLGRKVAIKVLPVRLTADRDSLTRFTHEARSASALNHPNIVTIHEVGLDNGRPYIVMEHIEGRDLRSYVTEGPLTTRKTLDIAAQIADGLAAAHEQGIIHRDLKPENLMVTKDGFVKILDFGLAKVMRPASGTGVTTEITAQLDMPATNPGTILGTVGYMSPEQASGRPVDFRSDQFAFGAILYELATGNPAFEGDNAIDTLSAILHDDPVPIPRVNVKAPAPFCWIVERLLEKEPTGRYESTRDLARELRTLRDRSAAETGADSIWPSQPPPRRKTTRRRTATIVAATALTITILLTIGVAFRRAIGIAATPEKRYVAVMRFKDLTGEPNGQLVVDGFAETLTARLARFPAVQVMRPTTADTTGDIRKIAHDLGANLALTGSMQRDGDRVRVAYHLIDVEKNTDTPGDLIEGSMADLFGVQDKLAESVASALKVGATPTKAPVLDASVSQKRYLEAIGYLRRYDNETSVDSAIGILEELSNRSASASIQAALGSAFLAKFQLTRDVKWAAQARAACERALSSDPNNPDVHVIFGELRRRTGQYPEAIAEFQRALGLEPNNSNAVTGLAETYKATGDLVHAESAYKRAIDLTPNYWGAYNKLGAFYLLHGRYTESVRMFQRVLEFAPDSLWGHNNLGAAYEQLGRYDDAIKEFSTTIKQKPTGQAYSNMGTCLYFQGRYADAAHAFEEATRLSPGKTLYWANLGDAYRWSGNTSKATETYQRTLTVGESELRVNPNDAIVHATIAACLAKLRRFDEAKRHIDAAVSAEPQNVDVTYKAALVSYLQGDSKGAVQIIESALARGYSANEIARDPEFTSLVKKGTITGVQAVSN